MDINLWAVIVAALTSFLLGGVWYSPVLFLRPWNKAMRRSEEEQQAHPARVFGLSFLFAVVSAYLFAWLIGPQPDLRTALTMGLIVGLGFVALSFGINYQFADRPFRAWFIDGGYHTLQFVLYGLVLGLWH